MPEHPSETAEQPTGNCPCCRKRDVEPPQLVCEPCGTRLKFRLRDLGDEHAKLGGDPVEVDDRDGEVIIDKETGNPVVVDRYGRAVRHHDPALPAAPLKGRSGQPHVSGSPDPSTPLDLQAVDLDGHVVRLGGMPVPKHRPVDPRALVPLMRIVNTPVRFWIEDVMHELPIRRREAVRNHNGKRIMVPAVDEIGPLPIAVRLDVHVRRWIELRRRHERRPVPTVPTLLAWLTARLDWALDNDPRLPELDADIRKMIAQVRGVLGLHEPESATMWGVPCRSCDAMNTLTQTPGDPYITCTIDTCGELLTDDEYQRWTGLLADRERQRLGRAGVKRALLPQKLKPNTEGAA
jgi:hypothetical protein